MKMFHVAVALGAVVSLTACGLTKSPAEDINFVAPTGWTSTPGIMGRFQLWTGGPGSKQVLMLMKLPSDSKIDAKFDPSDMREFAGTNSVKDATMLEHRTMKICGNQPATYMKMRGHSSSKTATEELIEAVSSKVSDGTFLAMHVYPEGSVPDPQAEAAIYELCPKTP